MDQKDNELLQRLNNLDKSYQSISARYRAIRDSSPFAPINPNTIYNGMFANAGSRLNYVRTYRQGVRKKRYGRRKKIYRAFLRRLYMNKPYYNKYGRFLKYSRF